MTADSALKLVNHAAAQDATWHIIALVAIGLVFASVLFRWFTRRLERVESKMDEQNEEFVKHLKTANREMLEVISSNQQTTNRAIQIMDRLETKLDRHTP
jgi:Tat protein secretion system quality control protein TatD with DNase activity